MDDSLTESTNIQQLLSEQGFLFFDNPSDGRKNCLLDNNFFFALVLNGTATLQAPDRDYDLQASDLFILTPITSITLTGKSEDFGISIVCMAPAYFDQLIAGQPLYSRIMEVRNNSPFPLIHLDDMYGRYLRQTFSLFSWNPDKFQHFQTEMKHHLCSFLLLQLTNLLSVCKQQQTDVKRSGEIYRKFRKLLVNHYKMQHDIHFYADRLHLSPTYLSRIVKRTTGRTVHTHLSALLSIEAQRLLTCTDMDIKEIADELGFSDQSVFGKFFVRLNGISPSGFRRRGDCKDICLLNGDNEI